MAEYKHGAYGLVNTNGNPDAAASQNAIVYVGTAPVHMVEGGADNVGKPVLVRNIAEAKKYFGWSEDFAAFTLCEAMQAHLVNNAIGPIVLINVLDPDDDDHKASTKTTATLTPVNGRAVLTNAADCIVDTIVVKVSSSEKVKGTDYELAYDLNKNTVTIIELTEGALSTSCTVEYYKLDETDVTNAEFIGTDDGAGLRTGLQAVKNVYQACGMIPAYLCCPGFGEIKACHDAMAELTHQINGHWQCWMFTDIPLVDNETAVTLDTAATWKTTNLYNRENETVSFPMATGVDGKHYHLSVLRAANFQQAMEENGGFPMQSASNTDCPIIANLYMGEANEGRVYDDEIINAKLNAHGIASAAFVGGRWAIWGAHAAPWDVANEDMVAVSETNRMMLYYISNDFQHRRVYNVDRPTTKNDVLSIVAEEQTRLDALVMARALIYGQCAVDITEDNRSDVIAGDFRFQFEITTMPLAKSLTAVVNWTDAGYTDYFETFLG